jgi:drug/metabolite transporter (DMT)-like permease
MLALDGLPTEATANGWLLLAYMGIVSTFLPFALFYWALQRVSATEASLVGYIVPIIGLVGGGVLLGEQVTWAIAGGGLLILGGVLITQRASAITAPSGAKR